MSRVAGPRGAVVVAGDVTEDWNLAHVERAGADEAAWSADFRTRVYPGVGGAQLLHKIIDNVAARLPAHGGADYRVSFARAADAPRLCSYAMWTPHKYREGKGDDNRFVWRVKKSLGLETKEAAGPVDASAAPPGSDAADAGTDARLFVLDDAALGFRDSPERWPAAIRDAGSRLGRPWVLLKMAQPVAQGALWEHLRRNFRDRLVVVLTVNDLRLSEVQISRGLSWERTAQDVVWELTYNPSVSTLSTCAHVVVSFDTAGAVLLSRDGGGGALRRTLFFDPKVVEGTWADAHPGKMIGYTSCLAASLACQLMLEPDGPDVARGIRDGLAAMRALHREGYGDQRPGDPPSNFAFPLGPVVDAIFKNAPRYESRSDESPLAESPSAETQKDESEFVSADVEDPARFIKRRAGEAGRAAPRAGGKPRAGFWTILRDRYGRDDGSGGKSLERVAAEIVLNGVEATLPDVPLGSFGALETVDRREIESYRSVRTLVAEYCRQERPQRPLSLAVFGPPGSGKSFGIEEVAKSVFPGLIKKLTFNLSQFTNPLELLGALHQVRDESLRGLIPLVFWDEFDTALGPQPLGWLRYFLAPMQDGSFQEGQITHPVGRAVFVFAGGTSRTLEGFGAELLKQDESAYRAAKVPDFVSRLKGYVNILGPDPRESDAESDPFYLIRRAILLRSMLSRQAPQLFDPPGRKGRVRIDRGVLRAFLLVGGYEHGARSMESVIAMSQLAGRARFERSALPSELQLDLHVRGRAFLALVNEMLPDEAVFHRLAAAYHAVYREGVASRGEVSDNALREYEALGDDERQQNLHAVADIPAKLAQAGYVMTPARSDEPPFDFPGPVLEELAEREHERWMRLKIAGGFSYGPDRSNKLHTHPSLLPWRVMSDEERARVYSPRENEAIGRAELPESEKEKDRDLVRGIPLVLAVAGYTVVRVREDEERGKAAGAGARTAAEEGGA